MLLSICSGCSTIGVKKEVRVVYVTMGRFTPELKGQLVIATNKPIPVTVGDDLTEFDAGGYILVHSQDLKQFEDKLKRLEKNQKL